MGDFGKTQRRDLQTRAALTSRISGREVGGVRGWNTDWIIPLGWWERRKVGGKEEVWKLCDSVPAIWRAGYRFNRITSLTSSWKNYFDLCWGSHFLEVTSCLSSCVNPADHQTTNHQCRDLKLINTQWQMDLGGQITLSPSPKYVVLISIYQFFLLRISQASSIGKRTWLTHTTCCEDFKASEKHIWFYVRAKLFVVTRPILPS